MRILNWKVNLAFNAILFIIGIILLSPIGNFIKYSHGNILGSCLIGWAVYGIVINIKRGIKEKQ